MVKRYVQETNALDLSKFHHDPGWSSNLFMIFAWNYQIIIIKYLLV